MSTRYRKFGFQLQDRPLGADQAGPSIIGTGSKCIVTEAGDCAKLTLYDKDGAALANPISLTAGQGEFYTLDTVEAVDIFVLTGEGYSVQLWSVAADELHLVPVDRGNLHQMLVLPISIDDQVTDATSIASGLTLIVGMVFEPWPVLKVVTTDAGITVDVGINGDTDGFISAVSTTTAGLIEDVDGTLVTSITTYVATAVALEYGFSTTADTAEGYAFLPYMLMRSGTPTI